MPNRDSRKAAKGAKVYFAMRISKFAFFLLRVLGASAVKSPNLSSPQRHGGSVEGQESRVES